MPGLKQLQIFNQNITALGQEPERKKKKGETVSQVQMPEGIYSEEDFDDFMFGLPGDRNQLNSADDSASIPQDETQTEDTIDIDQLISSFNAPPAQDTATFQETPQDSDDFSIPGIDNSMDFSGFGDFGDFTDNTQESSESADVPQAEATTDDFSNFGDLGELDSLEDFDLTPENSTIEDIPQETSDVSEPEEFFDLTEDFEEGLPTTTESTDSTPTNDFENATSADEMDFSIPEFDIGDTATQDEPIEDFTPDFEDLTPQSTDSDISEMDFSIPESESTDNNDSATTDTTDAQSSDFDLSDISFDLPETDNSATNELDSEMDFSLPDFDESEPTSDTAESSTNDEIDLSLDDFPADFGDSSDTNDTSDTYDTSGNSDFGDTGDFINIGDSTDSTADDFSMPENDDSLSADFGDLGDIGDIGDSGDSQDSSVSGGLDDGFDNLPTDAFDVEPETDNSNSGFQSTDDDEFSIAGFTDGTEPTEATTSQDKKKQAGGLGNKKKQAPSNELTEQEYETFTENLNYYPLNVRLAIEEMIVKNELTDEIIMKVIRKVIKRVPARQIANNLEKLLDITLSVPINYEKRTAEEYEAYRKSFEYRLKNQILPFLAVSAITVVSCIIIGVLATKFLVRPIKAQMLYKEGYALIQNELYPQSEDKFIEATSYNRSKKWYFNYARAYAEHKQFQRARDTYTRLLYDYKHDKTAGLEYVKMELEDLSNYQGAETLLRREVLDYHTNDPEALLLLGDIYLEWATNKDPSKYELARAEYASLVDKYGQQPVYMSRMMRYFIRTDNLKEVLTLKEFFFPRIKKKILEPNDLIELSEYMLEKQHGTLAPKEEYLRTYIEDVRSMLEQAVIQAPDSPEALYNYGNYFVYTHSDTNAQTIMEEALRMFQNSPTKNHKRIQKHIDTNRVLGEISYRKEDYLKAENYFVDGLKIFEDETARSGLKSNPNIGQLYADLANIDYFISGDKEAALNNYVNATQNYNDTPSINYRIGYLHYSNNDYANALNSFAKTIDENPADKNALLAMGNTLLQRNSISAATGYYEKLKEALDLERNRADILFPQVNPEDADLVEQYMKVANNLGVSFVKRGEQTGNSSYIAKAMANFEESMRAFDALTRNQQTMIRLGGSNLAALNQRYLTYPDSTYESAIYTSISPILEKESIPEQSVVR